MNEKTDPKVESPHAVAKRSWWLDASSREDFDAAAKREEHRMRQIKVFGLSKRGSDPSGKGRW